MNNFYTKRIVASFVKLDNAGSFRGGLLSDIRNDIRSNSNSDEEDVDVEGRQLQEEYFDCAYYWRKGAYSCAS